MMWISCVPLPGGRSSQLFDGEAKGVTAAARMSDW